MGILVPLTIGLVAGALSTLLWRRDVVASLLLGVVGAVAAYFFGSAAAWYAVAGRAPGLVASALGAVLALAIYRGFGSRRPRTT